MASSVVISISTARTQSDSSGRLVKSSSLPREEARALSHFFQRLAAGEESANWTIQTAALAPVRATGTVTLTYASVANNDTVTIAGTVLTCVTGTPAGAQFKKVTDGPTTAANLAALINSNSTLNKLVTATSAASVVTLTCNL